MANWFVEENRLLRRMRGKVEGEEEVEGVAVAAVAMRRTSARQRNLGIGML